MKYLLALELFSVSLGEAFCWSVTDYPVQKIEGMLLIFRISGNSEPIYRHWHNSEHESCGNREVEECRICEKSCSSHNPNFRQIPSRTERSIKMSCNARINIFIQIDLILVYLSYLLFLPQELKSKQLRIVVFGIRKRLDIKQHTSIPRWILCNL